MRCLLVSRQPRTLPVLTRPLRRLAAPGPLWLHKARLPVLKAALGLHWHMPASMDRSPSLSAFPWVVLGDLVRRTLRGRANGFCPVQRGAAELRRRRAGGSSGVPNVAFDSLVCWAKKT